MKTRHVALGSLSFVLAVICMWGLKDHVKAEQNFAQWNRTHQAPAPSVMQMTAYVGDDEEPLPEFVSRGLKWLAEAQFDNGGWGAGSHSRQDIRDPNAVQIDPATTAFSTMALLRAGNTLTKGPYRQQVKNAVLYMVELVESYPKEGPAITNISGTQPQAKLGQNIDVSMAAQLFTRVIPLLDDQPKLQNRVQAVLKTCLDKLALAQGADGSWNDRGGWASVLQSAMANNAFEMAEEVGMAVDKDVLEKSRAYQRSNVDEESGEVRTEAAAGISLYSIASNQRATAKEARAAQDIVERGRRDGSLPASAKPSTDNLQKMGYSEEDAKKMVESYNKNEVTRQLLQNDAVLEGFGNNGGEEFLSFMMTSESLVVTGGKDWDAWYAKMYNLLSSIQNNDGSWSGHHCITSPVFCTAAVILAMLAEQDRAMLMNEKQSSTNG